MPERPLKDDASLCSKWMIPEFEKIVHEGFGGGTLICAMTIMFGELVRERGGSDEPFKRAVAMSLSPAGREQLADCQAQIKVMTAAARNEGFSLDAILVSMIGALVNLYQIVGFPEDEIETAKEMLIKHLNARVLVN